jgi:hypothetical protein
MARAVPHVLRHRSASTKLQVVSDTATGLEAFAAIEKKVMRGFERQGTWPHEQVNLFVFETLQPLAAKIRAATAPPRKHKPGALAGTRAEVSRHIEELDRKPMVHVYDLANPAECSIFVNRRQMVHLGLWDDELALEALLAHEHAHPLSENITTRAARGLKVRVKAQKLPDGLAGASAEQLHHSLGTIVEELCLHAPHEVFANELAVRAGFGRALFHLNRISIAGGKAGLSARTALEEKLRLEEKAGRLSEAGLALILTMASIEAHVRMAMEHAAFARAGDAANAGALDVQLQREVFHHVEPEVGALYQFYCARYIALKPDLDTQAVCAWMQESCAQLTDALRKRGASFKVDFSPVGESV